MSIQNTPVKACAPEHCPELPQHLNRPRLNTVEAAEYLALRWGLRVASTTLSKLRCVGGGPQFSKYSRFPLYLPSNLDDWARTKMSPVVTNTSELPEPYRQKARKPGGRKGVEAE